MQRQSGGRRARNRYAADAQTAARSTSSRRELVVAQTCQSVIRRSPVLMFALVLAHDFFHFIYPNSPTAVFQMTLILDPVSADFRGVWVWVGSGREAWGFFPHRPGAMWG